MKATRALVAIVLGGVLIVGGATSQAAVKAKPVCNLLVDPAGDANGHDVGPNIGTVGPINGNALPNEKAGPSVDAVDIVSADLAADKHHVTGVIRVKKLALTDPNFPTGVTWGVTFGINDVLFQLQAHTNAIGTPHFDGAYITATGGTLFNGGVTGAFDLAKNEVHISIDNDTLAAHADVKKGTKITQIAASSGPDLAVPEPTGKVSASGAVFEDSPWSQDSGMTIKTYVVGTPSCVTPGK